MHAVHVQFDRSVAVVIPCFDQARFLKEAIESALAQSVEPAEIVVIDDGSSDDPAVVTQNYSRVTLIRQPNRGLAAARNTGLARASAGKIVFLDADDRLLPGAIETGLRCFEANPDAAFVYGAYQLVRRGRERRRFRAAHTREDLIRCNWIAMIASVMFDRQKLVEVGGFDESLGMCEDWDLYLRATRHFPFARHDATVACYHWHGANMSADRARLRHWIGVVREKERVRGLAPHEERAWREGEQVWASMYEGFSVRMFGRLRRILAPRLRTTRDHSCG